MNVLHKVVQLFIIFMILLSIIEYIHAHEKATAKSHRAMKMRDPSLYCPYFAVHDGPNAEARIADIVEIESIKYFQNLRKA